MDFERMAMAAALGDAEDRVGFVRGSRRRGCVLLLSKRAAL
jgi:hypothetical protein